MRAYGIIKKLIWDELKAQIYSEDLGIAVPQLKERREEIEKQSRFKTILDNPVTQMKVNGAENLVPQF